MKKYFSTTFNTMLFIIGSCGFLFLTICFSTIFILDNFNPIFLTVFTISFTVMLIVFVYYFTKLVTRPLALITNILEKNDENSIAKLQSSPLEFSHIGNLFFSNNQQKIELQKAKDKAEENELLKSSFLTNLSHEIRTPMNAILGFSDIINTEQLTEAERKEYINVITRSGKNLVSIIDDLIEMSKIDTNQVKPKFGPFNLDAALNDIHQTIGITIPKKKPLQLILDQPTHKFSNQIISDETKFKQIVVNLVNNAIKYTEKGTVNFGYTIGTEDHVLEFYIKDTGIGISEAEHQRIFNRFNRIQNDRTINLSGLGLGLSISRAYVEMLEGKIWLESEENKGTTFYFTIPLKLNTLLTETKKEIKLNPLDKVKPLTILVAEDDSINFMLIKRVLSIRNYTVIRASNGEEAINMCRSNDTIQLVIMDIKMPKISGFEARTAIKQFKPYLPIIAHTAYSSAEIDSELYSAGFVDCISKPLDKNKLFRIIDRIEHLTPDAMTELANQN